MMRSWFVIFLTVIFCLGSALGSTQSLSRINEQISHTKRNIQKNTQQQHQLAQLLKTTEIKTGVLAQQLHQTRHMISQQQRLLNTLIANQHQYQTQLDALKKQNEHLMLMSYMLSREPDIKRLLNQENINTINRTLMYAKFIHAQQLSNIQTMQHTIATLQTQQLDIQRQTQHLQQLHHQQTNQHRALTSQQTLRQQLLHQMTSRLAHEQDTLSQLMHNKAQLDNEIQRLSNNAPWTGARFKNHALHWPTQGKMIQSFQASIHGSQLKWSGILVAATRGQPIYAIANGAVIFSKWLPGYGQLIIIDHHNGFLSLYGRVESVLCHTGQTIHSGDEIATVGHSGGFTTTALYFELRHNSKPINPINYLRKDHQ